ncbi:hypothetical protein HBI56_068470 [Parastagonospora nodorum]|uniref:RING-type domain-containing protein n=2 Tax=Phaeosphaeria nodorum (strain SN15 / ATCC MYA-4574 / FGSC 10173) TaxID=321614 RepID=A0A7U2EPJ7_PHANO|nr:hypothetical protein HBH56_002910 [Parastagonospora nodorum]QRC90232.1 hypothetical protein JI435_096370 [Parastagonospora nodorum SN15]KAH3937777.1 hypothetical protein HBH54_002910 [Parastagonospora nodorum]KAH3946699.1 hypothetical protein HBH53_129090 [Parastagonospora nodorum]KAH3975153.1 hypothetical protein HBH51_085680 [Parastagonospora nodorum]
MPAISSHDALASLEKREWSNTVGQSGMTPTAFAFLIPVFVVVVFAPFICVFCIKRKRRGQQPLPVRAVKVKKPALRRAEARERLKQFADASDVAGEVREAVNGETEQGEQIPVVPDSASTSEHECAICLSALHAPAPPEAALLAPSDTSIVDEAATNPTTPPPSEADAILKLRTCSHTFHAECLVSWFVLRKTTCPICRTAYISKEDMQAYEEEEAAETAVVEPMTVEEPPAAPAATAPSVTSWRYFWAGQSVIGRENALAATRQGVTDVEGGQQRERRWRIWRRS